MFLFNLISFITITHMLIMAMILYILSDYGLAILGGILAISALIVMCVSINRKKKKRVLVSAVVMGLCLAATIIWYILFPTAYPYMDLWVLGKTEEQIIAKYGEPDYGSEKAWQHDEMAYYTRYIIFDPEYYVITFDEEGKAIDVREGLFVPLGG